MYFPLDLQNLLTVLFFLDRFSIRLTNFPIASCFKISYFSSSIAFRKAALLSTSISIPSHKGKKRATSKSTLITTEHVQNVIKLKQNFPNNLFQNLSNFFHFSLGYCQFYLGMLLKDFKTVSFDWCMTFSLSDKWLFKIFLFWHLIIPNRNEILFLIFMKRGDFQTQHFRC